MEIGASIDVNGLELYNFLDDLLLIPLKLLSSYVKDGGTAKEFIPPDDDD